MKAVKVITGTAAPLDRSDVDTDQIIPSDYLKRVEKTGFDKGLFAQWREDENFVLNKPEFADANILVSGPKFGTGSSREHAVWALAQWGFDAVIAPSFGDIFRLNSYNNGLLPVIVEPDVAQTIIKATETDPELSITIDVEQKTLSIPELDNLLVEFPLDDSIQERFLKGLDEIALTLLKEDAIASYELKRHSWLPKIN
jgi:3-isopropylmalate/(R)-2-methylmalate dehydratase small subunit